MTGGRESAHALSNLEYLIQEGVLVEGTGLDTAALFLTEPMKCRECIAESQCADRYGQTSGENRKEDCYDVVYAYLAQDHKKEVRQDNGKH